MTKLYDPESYEQTVIFEDKRIGLEAIVSIHNTALGPSLGGTRMKLYESFDAALSDVKRLARGMTSKASISGLDLGGGKAVVIKDPNSFASEAEREAFFYAYGRRLNMLNQASLRYITSEDMGTSVRDMDYIRKATGAVVGSSYGFGDPSPSTANGVFVGIVAAIDAAVNHSDEFIQSVRRPSRENNPFEVAKRILEDHSVAIQGVGKVGSRIAYLLKESGVHVTISDIDPIQANRMVSALGVTAVDPERIHTLDVSVFVPCATGGVLNAKTISELNCRIVAGCANNQLESDDDAVRLSELGIIYVPEFVISAGGLIWVAQEVSGGSDPNQTERRVEYTITENVTGVLNKSAESNRLPLDVANEIADGRIEARMQAMVNDRT